MKFRYLLVAALFGLAFTSAWADPGDGGSNPTVQTVDRGSVRLIFIKQQDGPDTASFSTQLLNSLGARNISRLESVGSNLLSATVSQASLGALFEQPLGYKIYRDTLSKPLLQRSIPQIHADALYALGADGAGYAVAILDTGVDSQHPALQGKVIQEACFSSNDGPNHSVSLCPNSASEQYGAGAAAPCALAGCEHGTHVAGIAASGSSTYQGQPIAGVAKGAKIIAVQVYSKISDPIACGSDEPCPQSWASDQIKALDYIASLARMPNARIAAVNLSLGSDTADTAPCDDNPLKARIDTLHSLNVLTVIAAGNDGHSNSISTPACISTSISVAAEDHSNAITGFSNRSRLVTLAAPGDDIVSTWAGGGYRSDSGTSMAAPFVAGAIAILRAKFPNRPIGVLQNALVRGGASATDPVTMARYSALDARAAYQLMAAPAMAAGAPAQATPQTNVLDAARFQRVIVTTQDSQNLMDVVKADDAPYVVQEKIAPNTYRVIAPADVVSKIGERMKISPDTLSKPQLP